MVVRIRVYRVPFCAYRIRTFFNRIAGFFSIFIELTMLPSLKGKADDRSTGNFLKLDNDISLSKSGLKVETVFFDTSTGGARSKNLFTFIFGKVMEWRAKNWVKNFVEKNKYYLPGADIFLKNINSSSGVKRNEVMSLLASAKIARSPIFSMPEKNTQGLNVNYLIKDPGESVIDFFVKSIDPAPSRDAVKVFFNFVEKGSSAINYGNAPDALNFLDNFRLWSEKNPEDSLLKMVRGNVNLFRSSVIKKIDEFNPKNNDTENKTKNIKMAVNEKNIKDAFDIVREEEDRSKFLFYESLGSFKNSSIAYFLGYIRNGASAINFSNIEKLELWANKEMQIFIESPLLDHQYLIPSLQVVCNQLKINIREFNGDSYKGVIDRPDFFAPKTIAHSDNDS